MPKRRQEWTPTALAREFGLDRRTVQQRLKGVKPCNEGGPPRYHLVEAAPAIQETGKTLAALGRLRWIAAGHLLLFAKMYREGDFAEVGAAIKAADRLLGPSSGPPAPGSTIGPGPEQA